MTITLINNSPRVTEDELSIDFRTNFPASSRCELRGRYFNTRKSCEIIIIPVNIIYNLCACIGSSGSEQFTELNEGKYILRIVSFSNYNGERDVLRREINIGDYAIIEAQFLLSNTARLPYACYIGDYAI